jgi:hypothetical protein
MTVIDENTFATGDDEGTVKCTNFNFVLNNVIKYFI